MIKELATDRWPTLSRSSPWASTGDYLHLVSQMLGKLSLALAPRLPEWFQAPLAVTPRGLATRLLASGHMAIQAELDVIDNRIAIVAADGRRRSVALSPARPISRVWRDFRNSLAGLGVDAAMWDQPQERRDAVPFAQDDRPRDFDQAQALAWLHLLTDVHATFDEWRSPFFGRSGVNFWWGGFDLAVGLYTGRRATPPHGANYIRRYDLDAEHLNVGFWPGDDIREAMFFGYLVPEPPGCEDVALDIDAASWAPSMGEWVLPYSAVLNATDRGAVISTFADTIYRAAGSLAGWDLQAYSYVAPPSSPRAISR